MIQGVVIIYLSFEAGRNKEGDDKMKPILSRIENSSNAIKNEENLLTSIRNRDRFEITNMADRNITLIRNANTKAEKPFKKVDETTQDRKSSILQKVNNGEEMNTKEKFKVFQPSTKSTFEIERVRDIADILDKTSKPAELYLKPVEEILLTHEEQDIDNKKAEQDNVEEMSNAKNKIGMLQSSSNSNIDSEIFKIDAKKRDESAQKSISMKPVQEIFEVEIIIPQDKNIPQIEEEKVIEMVRNALGETTYEEDIKDDQSRFPNFPEHKRETRKSNEEGLRIEEASADGNQETADHSVLDVESDILILKRNDEKFENDENLKKNDEIEFSSFLNEF